MRDRFISTTGFGMVWMTPLEGVDVNNISQSDIVRYDGVPKYVGEGL